MQALGDPAPCNLALRSLERADRRETRWGWEQRHASEVTGEGSHEGVNCGGLGVTCQVCTAAKTSSGGGPPSRWSAGKSPTRSIQGAPSDARGQSTRTSTSGPESENNTLPVRTSTCSKPVPTIAAGAQASSSARRSICRRFQPSSSTSGSESAASRANAVRQQGQQPQASVHQSTRWPMRPSRHRRTRPADAERVHRTEASRARRPHGAAIMVTAR